MQPLTQAHLPPPPPQTYVLPHAAIDELLERILRERFVDGRGQLYSPAVVRVGSDDAPLSEEVKEVWIDRLVGRYLDIPTQQWRQNFAARTQVVIGTTSNVK